MVYTKYGYISQTTTSAIWYDCDSSGNIIIPPDPPKKPYIKDDVITRNSKNDLYEDDFDVLPMVPPGTKFFHKNKPITRNNEDSKIAYLFNQKETKENVVKNCNDLASTKVPSQLVKVKSKKTLVSRYRTLRFRILRIYVSVIHLVEYLENTKKKGHRNGR